MKALVYNGLRNVSVSDVPDPRIGQPTDAIVQITRTNICGPDLHMYEGRTDMEMGRVLGHESLGRVAEVSPAVQKIKVGDMVAARSHPHRQSAPLVHHLPRAPAGARAPRATSTSTHVTTAGPG